MRGRSTEHDPDEPYCSERCQNRGDRVAYVNRGVGEWPSISG